MKLFQSLRENERRQLKKWLRSPLHLSNTEIRRFFDFLITRKTYTKISTRKSRVFSFVFPDEKYHDARLRTLLHDSLMVLEKFVGYFDAVLDEIQAEVSICESLSRRGMDAGLRLRILKLEEKIKANPERSTSYHQLMLRLEALTFELSGTDNRMEQNNLPGLFSHLSTSFAIQTLRYACAAASHKSISRHEYQIPLLSAILDNVALPDWEDEIALKIYASAFLAVSEGDAHQLESLIKLLPVHRELFSRKEQQDLLLMAINACIRQINSGNEDFLQKALSLYRLGLSTEILFDHAQLSRFHYKNIVSIALKSREYEWTKSFIHEYVEHLDAQFRDSYLSFNLARLHFASGEYRLSRQQLRHVEYDDIFFNLGAKMMLLKMAWESEEVEEVESSLSSFRKFVMRRTDLGYHRELYLNFLSFIHRMNQLMPDDVEAKVRLKGEVEISESVAEKQWLLQQLEA